ncbi:MAG TPA: YjjG family noncanonical pyrimidine nucleotidase [Bacteroidales bacterium]|nr:YjjG family noncanonical pyrimidine nucleotidase [Bacteroidales bacterium]HOR59739.1 YjjG family noncanonical pyrimidine nucleotidase [Bacteroidales bacterium]HPL04704.1 YjjG family noncanonical pyrimidine nucleotidase [Bacteroidales bacterium]
MDIKSVLIDLDKTLWDFDTNSNETIEELFYKFKADKYCSFSDYIKKYREINNQLWEDYRNAKLEKDILIWSRYYLSLKHFGLDNKELAQEMGQQYLKLSPTKTKLIPNSIEILEYLQKKYKIYLVTNGFIEVQYTKVRNCKIEKYFDRIFTSEEVGYNKPHQLFFDFVLKNTYSTPENSIMIGDDINVDIIGAAEKGIKTIWCNFNNETSDFKPDFEVKNLLEIKNIL